MSFKIRLLTILLSTMALCNFTGVSADKYEDNKSDEEKMKEMIEYLKEATHIDGVYHKAKPLNDDTDSKTLEPKDDCELGDFNESKFNKNLEEFMFKLQEGLEKHSEPGESKKDVANFVLKLEEAIKEVRKDLKESKKNADSYKNDCEATGNNKKPEKNNR